MTFFYTEYAAVIHYGKYRITTKDVHNNDVISDFPIVRNRPNILLKDAQTIISISFRFNCIKDVCLDCKATPQEKRKLRSENLNPRPCIFSKTIKILDSYFMLPHSLDELMNDALEYCQQTHTPIENLFKNTYSFATELGLSHTDAIQYCSSKVQMPFELCTSVSKLKTIVEIPTRQSFVNRLSNSDQAPTEDQYEKFKWLWNTFKCENLLDAIAAYVSCDSLYLSDLVNFHYTKIHRLLSLWPSWYLTISQLGLASALYNSKNPLNKKKPLILPMLNKEISQTFDNALIGGYSAVLSSYNHFTNAMMPNQPVSTATFADYNSLYSFCLRQI